MTILVTGATGFIGQALVCELNNEGLDVVAAVRMYSEALSDMKVTQIISDLSPTSSWRNTLKNISVVIHAAARVHIMKESAADSLKEFRKINTVATLNLARQAAEAGVKRFIYISSIKVNGEGTEPNQVFRCTDTPMPMDAYAISKYEAEQGLLELAEKTGMEVVIIRPPLVYGPGVKANFYYLIKWLDKGVPLPLGAIYNQRSFVALDNLISLIVCCIDHPKATNEVFLISDGKDVSTTELCQKMANALAKKVYLFSIPLSLMRFVANMLGKADVTDRLFGTLIIDSTKARDLLDWKPVVTMEQELNKTVEAYRNEKTV